VVGDFCYDVGLMAYTWLPVKKMVKVGVYLRKLSQN